MDKIFLVLGYGIPKDIFQDLEYRSYLACVFNKIFEYSRKNKDEKIHVIFCGGKTDMIEPYKRTEAGEMKDFFEFLAKRDFIRKDTGKWILLADAASLSTMENLLNSKKIIEKKNMRADSIGIFCEFSRRNRIKKLAGSIFGGKQKFEIIDIDFSISENRYLPEAHIAEKEKSALAFDLWALKSDENFRKYHKNFVDKFNFLRSYGLGRHQEAIRDWWEKEIGFLEGLNVE